MTTVRHVWGRRRNAYTCSVTAVGSQRPLGTSDDPLYSGLGRGDSAEIAVCHFRTLYGAIFVKGVPQGSYPFLRPSVSLFDLGSPFLRSLIATQKAITKLSVSRDFFFTSHFPSSTAPQAFPRPDRGDAHAVERKVASRLAALAATARLGLDATEHDGTLLRSGGLFPLLAYRRNIRPTAECIVLFAVGPVSSPHHGLRRLRRRYVPNAIRLCREKKRAVAETRPSRDDVSLRRQ